MHVVAATVRGGAVRIEKAQVWEAEQTPNPAEAEALGKWLRERLKEAGISAAPVLACLGRDRLILKDLRFPAVPDAEEPAIVRFQAVKELTEPPDEVVIDYARVGHGNGERRALAPIAHKIMVEAYQSLCKGAGLKLVGLTPRAFGISACLSRLLGSSALTPAPEPADAAVAVVTLAEGWSEFAVVRDGLPQFIRAMEPGTTLAGEVRRNLAVYAGQSPAQPIGAVYVAGGSEHGSLRERLRDMLEVPVYAFDPFAGMERPDLPLAGRGGFAGAVGLLHAKATGEPLPINFLKPRQPKPPRDPNQRKLVLGGALAAAALIAVVVFCYMQLSALDRQVSAQAVKNADLDRQLSVLEEDSKKFKALHDWDRKGVVLLDELYDVTERFPDPRTIQLTRFSASQIDDPKSKHAVRMTLEGIISGDTKLANKLLDGLGQDSHRRVGAMKTDPNTGVDRFNFREKFTSNVDAEKPPPDNYTARLPDPVRNNPNAEGGDQ
jgi:hypothetical protein